MKRILAGMLAAAGFAGAALLQPPEPGAAEELGRWLVRPAALPFLWRDLDLAVRSGDGAEAFARSQQMLELVPGWTDAQVVFAYRYATDGGQVGMAEAAATAAAYDRLQVALAWLETARQTAGRREVELLQAMAMLPAILVTRLPALEAMLLTRGGLGAGALGDRYLAAAERLTDSPVLREQRLYLVPTVAASLLGGGDRERAMAVLEWGIRRAANGRDRTIAEEWAALLRKVLRHLRGDVVDLDEVAADPRMTPLLPHLR